MTTRAGLAPGDTRPPAWWGIVLLVTTEAMVFAGLISAYFFERAMSPAWPLGSVRPPELTRPMIFTVVLVASSIPIVLAERAARHDRIRAVRRDLAIAFVMAAAFLANQILEQRDLGFGVKDNVYTSLFVLITALHGLHLLAALLMSVLVQAKAWTNRITSRRHTVLRVFGIYWHFVDGVWIVVFASLYVSAHLGRR